MSIFYLVQSISDQLIPLLALRGLPPLTDGKILLGPQHIAEMSAAPRVVFVPIGSTLGPSQPSSSATNTQQVIDGDPLGLNDGQRNRLLQRPIANDAVTFEIHCHGDVPSQEADPDLAYDYAQALAHTTVLAVNQACGPLTDSSWEITNGVWRSSLKDAAKLNIDGQIFILQLRIHVPVLDVRENFVPTGTKLNVTDVTLSNTATQGAS